MVRVEIPEIFTITKCILSRFMKDKVFNPILNSYLN